MLSLECRSLYMNGLQIRGRRRSSTHDAVGADDASSASCEVWRVPASKSCPFESVGIGLVHERSVVRDDHEATR